MPRTSDALPEAIGSALENVSVRPDGHSALAWGAEIAARNPRHLRMMLKIAVYEHLHAGLSPSPEIWRSGAPRDTGLESRLLAAMPHHDTVARARPREWRAGELVADIDGVRVRVPAGRVLDAAGADDVSLALPAARPALSPGYFLADGSRGGPRGRPRLRVYVHLAGLPSVPAVWSAVLHCLEGQGVPYRAKVSSSPALLPRRDGLIVYLGSEGRRAAAEVSSSLAGVEGVGTDVSAFAARLAPGVAAAWEPPAAGGAGHRPSFGEHRALAVADGLVDHAVGRYEGPRAAAVAAALREAGIDPRAPYRNLDSPPLDLIPPGCEAVVDRASR
ncbi:T3SS effector HopA1 family protein [Streptomyces sp. MAR4 CNX-425]|uniref:T3SS effector HopA1 family protein n=1 Tax=Streptomyces sp. MAR4 CNX-425 TaxID=3406343 RepID=UPI003B50F1B6